MPVTIRGQRVKVICLLLLYSALVLSRLPVELKKIKPSFFVFYAKLIK